MTPAAQRLIDASARLEIEAQIGSGPAFAAALEEQRNAYREYRGLAPDVDLSSAYDRPFHPGVKP